MTTSGIASEIEDLIKTAKEYIVLVAPYLKVHKLVMQRLVDASDRNVSIILIYRKEQNKTKVEVDKLNAELVKLKAIENMELYAIENLHAKCFMNENKMIITSMNLHDYSEKNNREMGILINKQNERLIYKEAYEEFLSIKKASDPIRVLPKKATETKKAVVPNFKSADKVVDKNQGYCIRCGESRKFSVYAPLCDKCWSVWAKHNNHDFPENFCHFSGEPSNGQTSYHKPILGKNWKKAKAQYNLQSPMNGHNF